MRLSVVAAAAFAVMSCGVCIRASDIYVAQNATGANNGTACANAYAISWANSSGNWGTGTGKIGPGTTVHLCGTFTGGAGSTAFTFQGSGSSGNTITLKFESGALLTAPYWSSNGAVSCSNKSYITVDGGTNGLIQNTANGTALANRQTSTGFYGMNCTNSEVKNLTVRNIYVNQGSNSSASDTAGSNTTDIVFNGNSTNSAVDNNVVSQAKTGVQFAMDPNGDASGISIYKNTISDIDWGVNVGGGDGGDTANNVSIYQNNISNWTNWQFPTSALHQDGIILFNVGNPSAGLTANVYDNYIHGDLGVGSPTGFVYCADFTSCTVYNNLLVNTGHTIDGIMWLGQTSNLGKTMHVYNNTIVSNQNDIGITLTISGTATIENNIVTGVGVGIHDYGTLTRDVATSDHNVWSNGSGGAVQMATNDSSFISYQTWQSDGFDTHSVTGNPLLNGSYQVQAGSPAIGAGVNLESLNISSLDSDFSLTPRPSTGAWTAGAYAYSSGGSVATLNPPTGLTAVAQ